MNPNTPKTNNTHCYISKALFSSSLSLLISCSFQHELMKKEEEEIIDGGPWTQHVVHE
jgi:hypothetical protein